MSGLKEISNHIQSVRETQKITNAMYLIASTKLRRAKRELDSTRPYFEALRIQIKRIFRTIEDLDSPYFYPLSGEKEFDGDYAYLVITADKGLAGAYNKAVLKEMQRLMASHDKNRLFVVGEYGRHYCAAHGIPYEEDFLYTAENPTLRRAREICQQLFDLYVTGKVRKIFVIYTDMSGGLSDEAKSTRLLPFHRAHFQTTKEEEEIDSPFEFLHSVETVLENIIPSYLTGFIYSAMVDSFSSEQNDRMRAMDSANQNAEDLLAQLQLSHNHLRQGTITTEITEIAATAKAQQMNRR